MGLTEIKPNLSLTGESTSKSSEELGSTSKYETTTGAVAGNQERFLEGFEVENSLS